MKKIALLPNVITAFGLSCGLFAIFKMVMVPASEVTAHLLMATAGILLLAALADLADGLIARAIKAESDFGWIFDTLADAITFGVGPSVIILKSNPVSENSELSFLLTASAMVYTVCGVLRLVRFSLFTQRSNGDTKLAQLHKKYFIGLPIPASAAAAISVNLFLATSEAKEWFVLSEQTTLWLLGAIMTLLGYLMISRWRFPSLKSLHIRVANFPVVVLTVISAVVVFYGIFYQFSLLFFLASWGYVFAALILAIWGMFHPTKDETISEEEFE